MIRLYGSILALSLLLACCSCGRSTPGPAAAMLTQPTVGQGVEPETMAVLQRELSRLLEESAQARQQSTLLRPDAGRIVLLHESGRLVWDYSFSGDYDQNGVVNAADLVPLGQYFGQSGPFDRSDIRSLVDGDGNGSINLSDVAPIAQNFGNSFVGYAVHASSDPLDYPADGGDNGPGKSIWGANGHPRVITVGAVNIHDEWVGYTSQGPSCMSERKPDVCGISHFKGYTALDNGTSAACPTIAGVLGLLKEARPNLTQDEAMTALTPTARNVCSPGWDSHSGAGVVDAYAASTALAKTTVKA